MNGIRTILIVIVLCLAMATSHAQNTTVSLADANALLSQSKYSEAATAFQSLTQADTSSGPAWFGLGQALEQSGQHDKAIAAYGKSLQLSYAPLMSTLYTARAYAAKGDQEQAYVWLTRLSQSHPAGLLPVMNSSPAFAGMKGQPRFKEIQDNMKPCATPEYRQFDFWLGNWEVQNPQGQVVGHNNVTSLQGGCLLMEDWAGGTGSTGMSVNYYDSRDKKWHQLYYDNTGNIANWPPLAGTLADGKMVMLTPANEAPLARWTWYVISPGKVKQMAEQSSDGGKTWSTTWDSVYVKKAQ